MRPILIYVMLRDADDVDHEHGQRRWSAVPRVGDKMCVKRMSTLYNLPVVEVIWYGSSLGDGDAVVYVICEGPR